ncbi:YbhB/YbcL family Raf kinase inhibitor-like protein [Leuconostoc palmae]|uniref:YbhB/YbcL family Raf kinase inhibitor-like protein n=1 Tax=Leuconostoc palmae TaxID=501487 RepID=UPI001C7CEBE5|nr:YbhB/YbcL family Raf kinase inhibitor-like protein [Leuconostoc palmae]
MKLTVKLEDGFIPDKYAKYASQEYRTSNMPTVNFPITISEIPTGTKSLTVSLIDYDAVPVTGFPWIHWLAANLPVDSIPENLSETGLGVSGMNSTWHNVQKGGELPNPKINQAYIGPMPPDKTHDYTLTIFALDTVLDLQNGFFLNELRTKSKNHILAMEILELPARA